MIESLSSMYDALGSIPYITKKKNSLGHLKRNSRQNYCKQIYMQRAVGQLGIVREL